MSIKTEILNRYKGYLMLNRNIFIAGVCAFLASAIMAEAYYIINRSATINSTLSVAVEYGIYIPLFAYLYYRDNKRRYRGSDCVLWSRVFRDAKKLISTLSVAEIVYITARVYIHTTCLTLACSPIKQLYSHR